MWSSPSIDRAQTAPTFVVLVARSRMFVSTRTRSLAVLVSIENHDRCVVVPLEAVSSRMTLTNTPASGSSWLDLTEPHDCREESLERGFARFAS